MVEQPVAQGGAAEAIIYTLFYLLCIHNYVLSRGLLTAVESVSSLTAECGREKPQRSLSDLGQLYAFV